MLGRGHSRTFSLPRVNGNPSKPGRSQRELLRAITRHEHSRAVVKYAQAFSIVTASLVRAFAIITGSLVVAVTARHGFHPAGIDNLLQSLAALFYR